MATASSSSGKVEMAVIMEERPVFVETNIGTHMAVSVPTDITVADLKDKLEKEHFICFPEHGQFKVCRFMVKRKMFFYHLPDSMHIKYVFPYFRRCLFLFMDLYPLEKRFRLPAFIQRCWQCLSEKGNMDKPVWGHFVSEVRDVSNSGDFMTLGMKSEGTECRFDSFLSNMGQLGAYGVKAHELEDNNNPNEVEDLPLQHGNFDQNVPFRSFDYGETTSHLNSKDATLAEFTSSRKNLSECKSRGCGSSLSTQTPEGNSSQCMSISDIISRYFCDDEEMVSLSNTQTNNSTHLQDYAWKTAGPLNFLMRENSIESAASKMTFSKKVIPGIDMAPKVIGNKKEQPVHLCPESPEMKVKRHSLSVKKTKGKSLGNKNPSACDNSHAKNNSVLGKAVCGTHPSSRKLKPISHIASTRASNGRVHEDEVGRCILRAANNISNQLVKLRLGGAYSENNLCYRSEQSLLGTTNSLARSTIFEISENEG